jgi:CubicO group peptidase (beta-lactamase class C family)
VDPPASAEGALELILDSPANFAPGTDYHYSNTNYLLLSMLIERVSGVSKIEFLRQNVLDPLGLENTFGSIDEVNLDDVMSGYYVGYPKDIKPEDQGMLATAEDVGIFLRALNDGSIFEKGAQEIYSSIYVYNHTGLVPGYQSIAEYIEDIDTVVIQFTNTVDFEGYNWNISEVIFSRIVKIIERRSI